MALSALCLSISAIAQRFTLGSREYAWACVSILSDCCGSSYKAAILPQPIIARYIFSACVFFLLISLFISTNSGLLQEDLQHLLLKNEN